VRTDDFARCTALVRQARRDVPRDLLEEEPRGALEQGVEELREDRAGDPERDRIDEQAPLPLARLRLRRARRDRISDSNSLVEWPSAWDGWELSDASARARTAGVRQVVRGSTSYTLTSI
jgi:hypothetical protein